MIFLRTLMTYLMPGGVILAAALVAMRIEDAATLLLEFAWAYPYIVAVVALLFGWRFNRSRLLFGVLCLVIVDQLFFRFTGGDDASLVLTRYVFHMATILLPFNFMLLCWQQERGILTLTGILRFSFLLLQPVAAGLLYPTYGGQVVDFIRSYSVVVPLLDVEVSSPALALNGLALILLFHRFARNRDPLEHGLFWALVAGQVAIFAAEPGLPATVYFSVAGLILIIGGFESAHSMAFRDELTTLPARRALTEAMVKLGNSYSVAMLDIDFFKKFNDRYGHDVGDQVLAMVAAKLKAVGGGGRAFRYGGEEFTILFPGKSVEEVLPHLEEVRKVVAASGFSLRSASRPRKKTKRGKKAWGSKKKVSVTISIGVAERRRKDKPFAVLKAADKALYKAKNAGRNQVAS